METVPPTADPPAPAVVWKLTPASVEVCPGDACFFSVEPAGSGIDWKLRPEAGSIDEHGVYLAPRKVSDTRVIVVLAKEKGGSHFAAGTITLSDSPQKIKFLGWYAVWVAALLCASVLLFWSLLATPQRVPMVIVNPPEVTFDLTKAEEYPFTAMVLGDAKNAVTWSIAENRTSAPDGESLDTTGRYKHAANATAKGEETVVVRAISVTDPSRWGTVVIHLAPNQHVEVLPQAVSAFTSQQIAFRTGDGSAVAWSLSRKDLGSFSADRTTRSPVATFTVGGGIKALEALQVNAWSPRGTIAAAAAIVVNPQFSTSAAAPATLLAFVMVMGALGSMLHFSSSFAGYVGNGVFKSSWFWYYILRPFVGGGLAVVFFFVAGTSLINGANLTSLTTIATVAALVGLFSEKAVQKLSDIMDTVLASKSADERKDKLTDPKTGAPAAAPGPKITAADPPNATRGQKATVKFTGTNLTGAKVKVNGADAASTGLTATGFSLELTAQQTAGEKVSIAVTTEAGSSTFDVPVK
jgi:hypothetical protein